MAYDLRLAQLGPPERDGFGRTRFWPLTTAGGGGEQLTYTLASPGLTAKPSACAAPTPSFTRFKRFVLRIGTLTVRGQSRSLSKTVNVYTG